MLGGSLDWAVGSNQLLNQLDSIGLRLNRKGFTLNIPLASVVIAIEVIKYRAVNCIVQWRLIAKRLHLSCFTGLNSMHSLMHKGLRHDSHRLCNGMHP